MPKLYKHQQAGVDLLSKHDDFALLLEMGAGKSAITVVDFENKVRAGEARNLLVIAPSGSYKNWVGEFDKWLTPETRAALYTYVWDSSVSSGVRETKKLEMFLSYVGDKPRALLVNVEALSRVEKIKKGVQTFLKSASSVAVVDEAQAIKCHDSLRTKFILALAPLARYRRILSGLIAPENPLDVFAPFFFLNPRLLGFTSYFGFRARHAIMKKVDFHNGDPPVNIVTGYRYLEELQAKIAKSSFRVRTADVVDLPERIYMPLREVELTPEQRRVYDQMKRLAFAEIEGQHITAAIAAGVIMKLQQITSGFAYTEDGSAPELPSNKIASLLELLEDFGGKAIVWAPFPVFLEKIASALEKEYGAGSVSRFWGETSSHEREVAQERFQNDTTCRFMVSNPSVGGVGNNWTAATLVVYMSNSFKNSERQQSEARAHRIGQPHPVTYVDIVARGTVDEKLVQALRKKMDLSSLLMGDELMKWVV